MNESITSISKWSDGVPASNSSGPYLSNPWQQATDTEDTHKQQQVVKGALVCTRRIIVNDPQGSPITARPASIFIRRASFRADLS